MKILRNYLDDIKPNFVSDGKHVKWFPLFDAIENLFFSANQVEFQPLFTLSLKPTGCVF